MLDSNLKIGDIVYISSLGDTTGNIDTYYERRYDLNFPYVKDNGYAVIYVDSNNPKFTSISGVLYDKEVTTIIACPASKKVDFIIPNSVVKIGYSTFENCSDLESIVIPSSVKKIGHSAFSGCKSLTDIIILNSIKSVERSSFSSCKNLSKVIFSESIINIGDLSFKNCKSLKSVYFEGNPPLEFGGKVFSNCHSKFKIYYKAGTIGWTNPWNGYRAEEY
jgi:hypothetical protein